MPRYKYIATYLLLGVLIAVVIWFPFGFEMGGLIEEWGFLGLLVHYGHFYLVGSEGLLPAFAMRPLTFLVPGLANQISANSFVSWHLLLILALVLKGVVGGWIVWRLFQSSLLSAIAVILFIVYPADTMHVSLRSLHIDSAITLVLLGVCALILALEWEGRGVVAGALAALAAVLSVAGVAMYEASIAMLLLMPGYFFVKVGVRGAFAIAVRKAWVWLLWGAGLGCYGVYLMSVSSSSSYQGTLVGGGGVFGLLAVTWPKLFTVGALHAIWGGWVEAFQLLMGQPVGNLIYLAVCTLLLITAVMGVCLLSDADDAKALRSAQSFKLALVGGGVMLAGYFPYLLSLPHLSINQRTFLAASPGAALVWIGVLALVFGRKKVAMLLAASAATLLGLCFQLQQFSHYQYLSDLQRKLLGEVVVQYGKREGSPPIVVRDHSNLLGHTWMFLPGNLGHALSYVVGRPTGPLEICRQPAGEWMQRDALGRTGRCYVADGHWVFEAADPVGGPSLVEPAGVQKVIRWPLTTTVTLDVGLDTVSSTTVEPGSKQDPANPTGLYEVRWPLTGRLWQSSYRVGECYRWHFGDVWSQDLPVRGNGWREAEWSVSGLRKTSSAWKTDRSGSLYFELQPVAGEYLLQFRMTAAANDLVLKSLGMSVNGIDLPVTLSGLEGVVTVPAGVLRSGLNVMVFQSEVAKDYYGLSIMLDWVALKPGSGLTRRNIEFVRNGC